MSTLANNAPGPRWAATVMMSSTEMYASEESNALMPSLTLQSLGKERSMIILHFPMLCPLGITPNLFVCTCSCGRRSVEEKGPSICPLESSSWM